MEGRWVLAKLDLKGFVHACIYPKHHTLNLIVVVIYPNPKSIILKENIERYIQPPLSPSGFFLPNHPLPF